MADASPPRAVIVGTGHCVPDKVLTNAELSKTVDTTDEWIAQRTGIRERRIARSDETAASLGSKAATRALQAAKLEPKDLDLIICATVTPEMMLPSTACFIAHSLGLDSTPAYDMNAACSGFVYGLEQAAAFIHSGKYKNILVIGSETLSRIVDWTDRSTCILFGDGAGAAVMQAQHDTERGLLYTESHADGGGWSILNCAVGSKNPISEKLIAAGGHFVHMKGREVFKFAVTKLDEVTDSTLANTGVHPDEIKLIVPHQMNRRIIDALTNRLGMSRDKALVNIDRFGNTSAASIPIALDEAVQMGKIQEGDLILFLGVGAGLTWCSALVRM
ncbi:MAG: beta-ketoacyl-ACP synthase III [Planctomycetota bacterium]